MILKKPRFAAWRCLLGQTVFTHMRNQLQLQSHIPCTQRVFFEWKNQPGEFHTNSG